MRVKPLTRRQTEIMRHLIQGRSSREIGQRMGTTEKTVSAQRSNILERLEARTTAQAVYLWLMQRANEIQEQGAA